MKERWTLKISPLARKCIRDLDGPSYRSLPDGIIRMNDNSNLFFPNPVIEKVCEQFDFKSLSAYPSVYSDDLREAIAGKFGYEPTQVAIGNGSDEVIALAVKTFLDSGDRVAIMTPTFEMYVMYVKIIGGAVVDIILSPESFEIDVDKVISSKPKIVFICSPNNPTGNCFKRGDIKRVIEELPALVIIDEAYCQFSEKTEGLIDLPQDCDNVLVLRTFSKAYALAGLRVGFGIGSDEVTAAMRKICAPFRLNRFSEAIALEAIRDDQYIADIARIAREEREWVSEALRTLDARVYPSETNFILFNPPMEIGELIQKLMEKGIAIRDCSDRPLLGNCARVTIGNRGINENFINAVREILEESN